MRGHHPRTVGWASLRLNLAVYRLFRVSGAEALILAALDRCARHPRLFVAALAVVGTVGTYAMARAEGAPPLVAGALAASVPLALLIAAWSNI